MTTFLRAEATKAVNSGKAIYKNPDGNWVKEIDGIRNIGNHTDHNQKYFTDEFQGSWDNDDYFL